MRKVFAKLLVTTLVFTLVMLVAPLTGNTAFAKSASVTSCGKAYTVGTPVYIDIFTLLLRYDPCSENNYAKLRKIDTSLEPEITFKVKLYVQNSDLSAYTWFSFGTASADVNSPGIYSPVKLARACAHIETIDGLGSVQITNPDPCTGWY